MILAMIKAVLPDLRSDKVSEIYDYLVDMGVETEDDLAYIEEDDLNKVLKPVQSRKVIAAWKNKGVPSYNASLLKRTYGAEPVTFVPKVHQIQNMASQNQINDTRHREVFSAKSEPRLRSTVVNIRVRRQSTAPPSVQDVYPDLENADPIKNDQSPPTKTPLPLRSSYKDWTSTFRIPWKKLPPVVMDCLLERKRVNWNMKSTIISIVCKEILKIVKFPLQNEIEVIAEKMWERFPESFCDGSCKTPSNKYVLLTKHMESRIKVLRLEDVKQPEPAEKKKRKQDYDKNLNAHMAPSNAKSFASSVPSAAPYSTSSSKPFATSEPSFSYAPSNQSDRSNTTLAESVSDNSIVPSATSCISTTESCHSFTSSTQTVNPPCSSNRDCPTLTANSGFVLPWHKLDTALLGSLDRREVLSTVQRQKLVHLVCDEFYQWKQKPLENITEESRKLAKQMFLKYPASLSNGSLGRAGGKKSCSSLAKSLRSMIYRIKERNKKEESANFEHQITQSDSGDSVEGLLDWAVNFRIPWEKMPYALLECLRNKQRVTPALRLEMMRIVCSDIQEIEENPSKGCVDFIAKKMCKMFPKSLCDFSGDVDGSGSKFLDRQLLLEDSVSYASKSFIQQGTLEHATVGSGGFDNFTGSDSMDEFVNVNSIYKMEIVNVVPGVDDRSAVMKSNYMNVNGYYDLNTNSYNGIADFTNTDYTRTFSGSGNNTTQYNYLNSFEQLIKLRVPE